MPRNQAALYLRHFVKWFVMGLVIGPLLLAAFLAGAGLFWLASKAFVINSTFDELLLGDDIFGMPFFATITVLTTVFTWLLFRCGVVLPHLATGHGDVGMWDGWRLTRPLAWPIVGAAVFAGIAQVGLMWFPASLQMQVVADADGFMPPSSEYTDAVLTAISYSLVSLFGAAILTEIYMRIGAEDFDKY